MLFGVASGLLAQDIQKESPPTFLVQEPAKTEGLLLDLKQPSQDFWQQFELSKQTQSNERPEENTWLRTFSLYPQSFAATKPEAFQAAPSRSYLLSLSDQDKANTPVGLANIANEDKQDIQNGYRKNLNTELLVGYQWGGFGSLLFGRGLQLDREGDTSFGHVNDMGWRLKFMKTF